MSDNKNNRIDDLRERMRALSEESSALKVQLKRANERSAELSALCNDLALQLAFMDISDKEQRR